MRRTAFLSLAFASLNNRGAIGFLPFRSTAWKTSFQIDSRPLTGIVTALSSSSGTSSVTDPTLKTSRINLREIFSGRKYLFTTRKNIRNYEWTEQEAEDLFESIFEIDIDDGTKNNAVELNSITIMKRDMKLNGKQDERGRKIGTKSVLYDVHDGQQRLVTLSLLLAAIRDELREKYPGGDGSEQSADEVMGCADEVSNMIYPIMSRLDPVCRIELRESSGNKTLHAILSRTDPETGLSLQTKTGRYEAMGNVLPEERSWKKVGFPEADQRILTVYNYFRKRLDELEDCNAVMDLSDNFADEVYLMVCIPSDTIIARNIVMGQGKGKNIEAVDFFKGMVCFNYNEEESVQDSTLERWNQLCEDVGRDVLEDACLLLAQRYQKTRVKRNGEITLVEQYLRDRIDTNEVQDGKFIFEEEISKAARALHDFREGVFVLKDTNGAEPPSLGFLRVAASIATCKEIEMVVLAFLTDKSSRISISDALRKLESVALWMMLTKPKPKDRFQRCLEMMDEPSTICLTHDEKRQICNVLNDHDFGKPSDRKKAAAILERLNQHRFVEKMTMIQPMQAGRHIEHVLPQEHKKVEDWNESWTQEDATQWKQRLGNLALLDQKSNSKIGNKPFAHKKENLRESPYPLTREIAEASTWDVAAVEANHRKYIDLAKKVWNIDPEYQTVD